MSEENKAISRRGIEEVWNRGNLDVIDEILAPNAFICGPTSPEGIRGPEGFRGFVTRYRTAYPDLHFTIENQIAEGDTVVTRWTARGTHKGDLPGIPATGKQVTVTGFNIDDLIRLRFFVAIGPSGQVCPVCGGTGRV